MATGLVQDHNLEKQMGCMAGFLQMFDRHQLLNGKRIYSTKRLPPAVDYSSESEQASPVSKELGKPQQTRSVPWTKQSAENPSKSPLPLSVLEFKEGTRSSWKFSREAPRLSLDSRAVVDAKGSLCPRTNAAPNCDKQRRSTSVIAKLMGLEPLAPPDPEPVKKSELRRSASESRVSRDLYQPRFVDGDNFQEIESRFRPNKSGRLNCAKPVDRPEPAKAQPQRRSLAQRKSFFDSEEVFPDSKQSISIYGEIERRLKMRGIDEPSKDLETLKQILEALQLKGLLHSGKTPNQRNDSPIVVMRPGRSPGSDSPPSSFRSRPGDGRVEIDRNVQSQARLRSPIRRKPLSVETQRKAMNQSPEQRRASLSPIHSPKMGTRRTSADQQSTNRSPRNRKPTAKICQEEDEFSSISECSISTPSHAETERSNCKDGRSLLERCDKLLVSIAEITATELQPSPVSVLDSSFYKEDSSSSPSPINNPAIHFKGQLTELDDEIWNPDNSDSDFVYISEIFRASFYVPDDSDRFLVLENKQFPKSKGTPKASRIHRKLIFDTVTEILDRQRLLPPWKAVSGPVETPTLHQTWSEFRRIRERDSCEEDLFELICGVLRKDLAGDAVAGWEDFPIETSEAVLDIERLIFKDLVGETIRELAYFGGNRSHVSALKRKLVF